MTTHTHVERPVIIITGASAGIGEAAARELARETRVIIVGRSPATKTIAQSLGVEYFRADFSKLADVRRLAVDLLAVCPRIDLLINNAGGIMKSLSPTKDGFEATFQVNYLAQFVLTQLLLSRLIASKGGVINTSSAAHLLGRVLLHDIQVARRPFEAYSNSKLYDLLHAQEISRRYGHKGVAAVSFHPGLVATSFAGKATGPFAMLYNTPLKAILKSSAQGADTLVWLARHRDVWQPGGYYVNRKIARVRRIAQNPDAARDVWDATEELLRPSTS